MNLNLSEKQIIIEKRTSKIENTIFLYILQKIESSSKCDCELYFQDFKKLSKENIISALDGLMKKHISYSYVEEGNRFKSTFPHITCYSESNSYIHIYVPPMISNAFKKNRIENTISLKTFFYFRQKSSHNFFNLILNSDSENSSLRLTLEQLKDIFSIKEDSYDRFFDFEKALLKPLIEKINTYSDYSLDYTKVKKGENKNNKVIAIEFTLKNNSLIEKSAETNYLIQLIKNNITDYKRIWEVLNSSIGEMGFLECKRAILFLKENNLSLSDDELINYLKKKGQNLEEILQLNNHSLIKEKMSLFKNIDSFTKAIYEIMIGYNFYYSLNFKFLKDIKEYREGNTFYYRDESYVIFGTYFENRGSFKIFQTQS
ncbi:MAG: replication initiation protein [Cetobacterium sp.]|uniref:replication initiation protein n=1 Tax=Cetobacterium sp. TaxID=2071632 RepID=UPI002FC970C1